MSKQPLVEYGSAHIITPDCDRTDCRIIAKTQPFVPMHWNQPVYDKYGNLVQETQTKPAKELQCLTCKKTWTGSL